MTAHKAGKPEATLQSLQAAQQAGMYPFRETGLLSRGCSFLLLTAQLISESSESSWVFSAAFISDSGREGPSESSQFQELPRAILSCLPSCLRSFPGGWNVWISDSFLIMFAILKGNCWMPNLRVSLSDTQITTPTPHYTHTHAHLHIVFTLYLENL